MIGAQKKTNGKIKSIMENLPSPEDCPMILLNAVYFFAKWVHKFKKNRTYDSDFLIDQTKKRKIRMMFQTIEKEFYYQDENVQAIKLPYSDQVAAFVLLPTKELSKLLTILDKNYLKDVFAGMKKSTVNLHLPKFKIESNISLEESLKQLGICSAFDEEQSDFGLLCKSVFKIKISGVVQKALIDVEEEGTEAVAITAVIQKNLYPRKFSNKEGD